MKLSDLKPAGYNPRIITDEQLSRLKKALHEFGDLSGIVFNRKTGNLVGGHQRLKCLPPDAIIKKEKLKKPSRTGTTATGTITIDNEQYTYREVNWDEAKEKAANIAANQHGGEFDDDKLSVLLKELSEAPDFDIGLLGFDDSEFNQLLSLVINDGLTDPDDVPEVTEAITKTGDLYILGSHRLLCGDATKKEDVERLMDGKKADMVFTDPPYGMHLDTDFSSMKGIGKGKKYKSVKNDDKDFDPSCILNKFDYCKEIFLWGADYYAEWIPERNKGSWFVWDKTEGGVSPNSAYDKMYGSNFELCWSKTKHKRALARILWKGIFGLNKDDTKKRIHPTQKPVELVLWFFEKFKADLILDPFLGSGSTMIAAEKTGRICYGMEIDPWYSQVCLERWAKYTGKDPIREDGKKWSELKREFGGERINDRH